MFLKPLFVALRGKSTGKVRWPSLRARAKKRSGCQGEQGCRRRRYRRRQKREAISTHRKSVMPKMVPILMVKFAFTQA